MFLGDQLSSELLRVGKGWRRALLATFTNRLGLFLLMLPCLDFIPKLAAAVRASCVRHAAQEAHHVLHTLFRLEDCQWQPFKQLLSAML